MSHHRVKRWSCLRYVTRCFAARGARQSCHHRPREIEIGYCRGSDLLGHLARPLPTLPSRKVPPNSSPGPGHIEYGFRPFVKRRERIPQMIQTLLPQALTLLGYLGLARGSS